MKKKNVVVIGGGHGQSVILHGLKNVENINLSTIVTVADDGGSTGRLRKHMNIPAMGDIRNVMVALSDEGEILTRLMDYRFKESEGNEIGGHSLGNLMLTALTQENGDFIEAINELSKVLRVKGQVIPSSTSIVTLCARMDDGTIVRGESNIPGYFNRISEVFYQEEAVATQLALDAIKEADIIIFGIGSLYTSIMPNIIIEEIRQALVDSTAKKVYLCNVMTQHGETDNYSLEDHVAAIEKHLKGSIDTVITCNDEMPEELLKRYEEEYSYPVKVMEENHTYRILYRNLLTYENNWLKHDPEKVAKALEEVIFEEN